MIHIQCLVRCCLVTLILVSPAFAAQSDAPPVQKLRDLYTSNPDFRSLMEKALQNVQSPYLDLDKEWKTNPWKDKSFDDFCEFFNQWYILLPRNNKHPNEPTAFPPGQDVEEFDYIIEFAGFYFENEFAKQIVGKEPGLSWTKDFVKARGAFMDSEKSFSAIENWITDRSIHIEEYVVPPSGFKTFNEFFTRELKPGKRTIAAQDDDSVLVAPTDCVLNMIQPIVAGTTIPAKPGHKLSVPELLSNSPFAEYFQKASSTAISCILLPNTYHHYHAVVSGEVVESKQDVSGEYWGMNLPAFLNSGNIGYGQSLSVFEHYRRGYVVIKTNEYGYVAMVPIGLDTIGSVVLEKNFRDVAKSKTVPIKKGEKVGHFAYGGSMVIILMEKGIRSVKVPLGQQIGVFDK